jgi:hypothetical protein
VTAGSPSSYSRGLRLPRGGGCSITSSLDLQTTCVRCEDDVPPRPSRDFAPARGSGSDASASNILSKTYNQQSFYFILKRTTHDLHSASPSSAQSPPTGTDTARRAGTAARLRLAPRSPNVSRSVLPDTNVETTSMNIIDEIGVPCAARQ